MKKGVCGECEVIGRAVGGYFSEVELSVVGSVMTKSASCGKGIE
jgi:hypothetical protein